MRQISLLIKNYFHLYLGSFNRSQRKAKYVSGAMLVAISALLGVYIFTNMAVMSIQEAIKIQQPALALYSNAMMCLLFVLFLTIFRSVSPSESTDDDLLLSLPFKKSEIVTSKVLYNYFFDFIVLLGMLMPSYVVYAIYILQLGTGTVFILRGLLVCLLLPCFSNALAIFLSIFFKKLSGKFRKYKLVQSILSIFLLLIFMVGYYYVNTFLYNASDASIAKVYDFFFVAWLVGFLKDANLLDFLYLVILCVIPFVSAILVKARNIGKKSHTFQSKKKDLTFKEKSVAKTLFQKELQTYMDTPVYVINTAFGAIFMVIMMLIIVVIGKNYLLGMLQQLGIPNIENLIYPIASLIIIMISLTICTTSCSISLEGKRLWILKAHPVKPMDVFKAKILLNFSIAFPSILISSILLAFFSGIEYALPTFLSSILASLAIGEIGLIVNLMYPKFDWESETQPVKQGLSVIITMIVGLVVAMVAFVLYFTVFSPYFSSVLGFWGISLYFLLCNVVAILILRKKGIHMFESL